MDMIADQAELPHLVSTSACEERGSVTLEH